MGERELALEFILLVAHLSRVLQLSGRGINSPVVCAKASFPRRNLSVCRAWQAMMVKDSTSVAHHMDLNRSVWVPSLGRHLVIRLDFAQFVFLRIAIGLHVEGNTAVG